MAGEVRDGGPAFPCPASNYVTGTGRTHYYDAQRGMSRRDYFAGQAMQQWILMSGDGWRGKTMPHHVATQIAENCVVLADAMLRALG